MTDKLRNTNPVHIAFRSIDLYRAHLEHGLSETVASAAAIGELKMELDDLERACNESALPEAPPADERLNDERLNDERLNDERSWERGGFSGRAGWEGRL